ncbi:MAG: hypothetical protein CO094_03715 [Anaerolineae bacterium CG_4_9_14_3_um_filter_57_17]|nr:hypothetical protein [bacterium]NCT20249.1 hypothetical protein [bacterium]OIO84734.1 MAG: hypothetical protein AUK01_07900 [Anaerolineae bacterium CG2_30_57_67]PJB67530.1 MAG: hypothetical protein CO094_03715 [Anaerolineae bacterium CG_4_9_14_3_um_filter_57_17]
MDELVTLVSKKTGLPKEQAKMAVMVVVDFIKAKLPPAMAAQVDGLLNGTGADVFGAVGDVLADGKIDASDAATLLGDLFGGGKKK